MTTADSSTIAFDNIHCLNSSGKLKLAAAGLGWKDSKSGEVLTERFEDFTSLQWLRSLRGHGFQLRVELNSGQVRVFEGFAADACDSLNAFCSRNYRIPLAIEECSGKGWNWGKLGIDEKNKKLSYSVAGKFAFQLPLNQVSNSLVAGKNELVCEFGTEGANQGNLQAGDDFVTEIRFYLPYETEDQEEDSGDENEEEEEANENEMDVDEQVEKDIEERLQTISSSQNLASSMLAQIKALCSDGKETAIGDIVAALPEVGFTTPRGRYRIDMFAECLRLHGKSHDYKIDYSTIKRLFLLPKTDDAHLLLVMAIDPPLRQGQTRYPYLIMQFPKEERIESLALQNLDLSQYEGKLQAQYSDICTFELVSALLRGLAGQKIVVPGAFKSVHSPNPALKCSIKANEGALYILEKNFLFLPKPVMLIPHGEVEKCIFSRVGASFGNPRSFDLKIQLRSQEAEHVFSNISKDELDNLMEFLQAKQIAFTTEKESTGPNRNKAAMDIESGSDEEAGGDAEAGKDEDESTDEDYQEGDDDEEDSEFDSEDDDEDGSDIGSDEDGHEDSEEEEEEEEGDDDEADE